jgi:DNA-binding NarL/FixJ family response regulator
MGGRHSPISIPETAELSKLRVVVADDHEAMREALVLLLRDELDIVGVSKDGRGLIDMAISLRPDVIVSDVMMPLLTGPQAREELCARGYNIPFVFVSTYHEAIRPCTSSLVSKMDVYWKLVPAVRAAASGSTFYTAPAGRTTPSESIVSPSNA